MASILDLNIKNEFQIKTTIHKTQQTSVYDFDELFCFAIIFSLPGIIYY